MEKIHDVVETSKMSAEYDGALIDGLRNAGADLDNGRLVVRDGDKYVYPTDITEDQLYLVTTPEKTYENVNMTEFYNKEGKKIRVFRIQLGDEFGTTAFTGELDLDDVVMLEANTGNLVAKAGDPAAEFTVVEKKYLSGFPAVVVEKTK